MSAPTAFALASLLHLGFQATVTLLVYPALVRVGREHPEEWSGVHAQHSRGIAPIVAVVYSALLASGVWVLTGEVGAWEALAGAGAVGAALTTAFGAAPTHGRLSVPEPALLRRLIVLDRVRATWAVVGAVASVLALV